MSLALIQDYLNELHDIRRISGDDRETQIREAFKRLLWTMAKHRRLVFVAEYAFRNLRNESRAVDGAVLYELRIPLGFYEAKDSKSNLDDEIEKKFRAGYPQTNIIFEDGREAVLFQNKHLVMRCPVDDEGSLAQLLGLFFDYTPAAITDFRKAVSQFARDIPAITGALKDRIETAAAENAAYRAAETKFLRHAKETINPEITGAEVREMLMQHILTEEIFASVFNNGDFHRENNVAKELYRLESTFFTGSAKRETLAALESYYAAIRSAAALVTSHAEKQNFLKTVYETFYKVYNPKAADRLGVVYTPAEIVDFMIDGADWLCREHFGKGLIDEGVEILDPATGTGTFVCHLIEKFRGNPKKLEHKYRHEIHANEVAILPYYVANLNIEATYAAVSGRQYVEFENLCFVDTLDNVAGLGKFSGHQEDLFGALSEVNIERIRRQNARKISVVIGNPPYNANQQNENDDNKNRPYPKIDQRIKDTYIKESTAQKTKAYDMYTRFFRWASDRIDKEGIVAFVTNRSFIDARTMDGFRKIAARDFSEIRIVDLGGDVRSNPKLSGTKHNVFGIQTGVAVSFLVRRTGNTGCRIFYARRPELETAEEKVSFLAKAKLSEIRFEELAPNATGKWIGQTASDFGSLIPLASKQAKSAKSAVHERAVFQTFSLGIVTNRDEWLYDDAQESLAAKVQFFTSKYEDERERITKNQLTRSHWLLDRSIKWTSELEVHLSRDTALTFDATRMVRSLYRPFVSKWTYFAPVLTHRPYLNFSFFPAGMNHPNQVISFAFEDRAAFAAIATAHVANKDMFMPSAGQCLPRYRYTPTGERIDNITDWALDQFRAQYGAAVTKDAIFHYVYAVLHDPVYRETYAQELKREFPRIPFRPEFEGWVRWGERLMALHVGFETVEPWPLLRAEAPDAKARAAGLSPKCLLKADRDHGIIVLDTETQLSGVPAAAWEYRLGNRSALDWILDQYKEKRPKDPTIREKFDTYRFADHKEKVVDLLMRVTRVSVETVEIVEAMRRAKR